MKEIFRLSILDEFQCIGSSCTKNCCIASWNIEAENEIVEKWKGATEQGLKEKLQDFLIEAPDLKKSFIKKDSCNRCWFLNEENLCGLQKKFGESYMPDVCKTFPRFQIESRFRHYEIASCACPEVVRLLFYTDNRESMFLQQQNNKSNNSLKSFGNVDDQLNVLLDEVVYEILSMRKFPLGVRLFYMSTLFVDIINQTSTGNLSIAQVEKAKSHTKNNLYEINIAKKQGQLISHPVTAGSFWRAIYELLNTREFDKSILESASAPLSSYILNHKGSSLDYSEINKIIKQYAESSKDELRNNHGELIEKFIKYLFISDGFPLAPSAGDHLTSLVRCMVGICLFQLVLWMRLAEGSPLGDEFMQNVIVELHRNYMHGDSVIRHLQKDSHMRQIDKYCLCFLQLF